MFGENQLMVAYVLFLLTTIASPLLLKMAKKNVLFIAQIGLICTLLFFFVADIASMGIYADSFNLFNGLAILNTLITVYALNAYLKHSKTTVGDETEEFFEETIGEERIYEENEEGTFPYSNTIVNGDMSNGSVVYLSGDANERKENFLQTIKERNGIEL